MLPPNIRTGVPLKEFTTLHIGGDAEYFTEVTSEEALRAAIQWAREQSLSWRIIGGGSNILFGDGPVFGLTIKNALRGIHTHETTAGVRLTCGAGESLDEVVAYACTQGWWGLENLSAIPGTVGATPVQNVGAYGTEVANLIQSVSVYDAEGDIFVELAASRCGFAYRHSLFKEEEGKRYVIARVSFLLPATRRPLLTYRDLALRFEGRDTDALTPHEVRDAVCAIRAQKFPNWRELGTAGSFFKNPIIEAAHFAQLRERYPEIPGHSTVEGSVKVSLGWILDHVCDMRGHREGNVGTYGAQALVVVNYGGATAAEVLMFSEKIAVCVREKTNIAIEREVTCVLR